MIPFEILLHRTDARKQQPKIPVMVNMNLVRFRHEETVSLNASMDVTTSVLSFSDGFSFHVVETLKEIDVLIQKLIDEE